VSAIGALAQFLLSWKPSVVPPGPAQEHGFPAMTLAEQIRLTRREVGAALSRLNRSRLGRASTGSLLGNISSLLQVLAIVAGGVWVMIDYFDFKSTNNTLTNKQLELANQTAQLTQSSIAINNQLTQLKLYHAVEGRLEMTSNSSIVRSKKFADVRPLTD
jgi:hypothetical protein